MQAGWEADLFGLKVSPLLTIKIYEDASPLLGTEGLCVEVISTEFSQDSLGQSELSGTDMVSLNKLSWNAVGSSQVWTDPSVQTLIFQR